MLGRAAVDDPWIFRKAHHYMETGEHLPNPTLDERFTILLEHMKLSVEHKGERKGVIEFRKHYAGYLRALPNASKVRQELMQFVEFQPVEERLRTYHDFLQSLSLAAEPV
jgi:tRNA-dihydrouridine synthase B